MSHFQSNPSETGNRIYCNCFSGLCPLFVFSGIIIRLWRKELQEFLRPGFVHVLVRHDPVIIYSTQVGAGFDHLLCTLDTTMHADIFPLRKQMKRRLHPHLIRLIKLRTCRDEDFDRFIVAPHARNVQCRLAERVTSADRDSIVNKPLQCRHIIALGGLNQHADLPLLGFHLLDRRDFGLVFGRIKAPIETRREFALVKILADEYQCVNPRLIGPPQVAFIEAAVEDHVNSLVDKLLLSP
mmetsp:Transcript_4598/g.10826  ORF Transcript_4598/g.10826 Transcript_4598/m.10826 type:complete len:240 (-) Transcript_4598:16-735(-)